MAMLTAADLRDWFRPARSHPQRGYERALLPGGSGVSSVKAVAWCDTPLHHSMGERMIQQEPNGQDKPANRSHISGQLPDRRAAASAAALLVVGLAVGYVAGQQRPAMHEAEVGCLSAVGAISCTDDPDPGHGEFWVPRDVAWIDSRGSLQMGDRPECLPPTGRGTAGPVGITWVTVEVSGTSWKQVVGVEC
jgi:hypothetical protein